jgi:hypothetical protein
MKFVKGIAQRDPSGVLVVLSWVAAGVCGLLGQKEYASALVAAGAGFLGLRTQVVPVSRAKTTAISAATDAATTVAANLTADTVGEVGQVTTTGEQVVADAVGLVEGLIGGKK